MTPPEKTLLSSKDDYLQWKNDKITENNYDAAFTDDPEKFPCVAILMIDENDFNSSSAGTAYSTFIYQEDFNDKTYEDEHIYDKELSLDTEWID